LYSFFYILCIYLYLMLCCSVIIFSTRTWILDVIMLFPSVGCYRHFICNVNYYYYYVDLMVPCLCVNFCWFFISDLDVHYDYYHYIITIRPRCCAWQMMWRNGADAFCLWTCGGSGVTYKGCRVYIYLLWATCIIFFAYY